MGPHLDSYDVFLVQGQGQRRWQYGTRATPDARFRQGLDLRILERFQPDADEVLEPGDMLYLPYDQGRPVRVQGAWVSDEELSALVKHWKAQGSPNYVSKDEIDSLALRDEEAAAEKDHARSALVDRALEAMRSTNSVSVSFLQRKLGIEIGRAHV